jgi:hypothetical protein
VLVSAAATVGRNNLAASVCRAPWPPSGPTHSDYERSAWVASPVACYIWPESPSVGQVTTTFIFSVLWQRSGYRDSKFRRNQKLTEKL